MAIKNFSSLINGQSILFNPNVDVLRFDNTAISATSGSVTQNGANLIFHSYAGKTITLRNVLLEQLTTTNVTFANGSQLMVGNNAISTAKDAAANQLLGGNGDDLLYGLGGNDSLNGGAGNDVLNGGGDNDVLNGSAGKDKLYGNAGNDSLNGGSGKDMMDGGLGNDTYTVDTATDQVVEKVNAGIDSVNSSVSYVLTANVENLILTGTTAINGTGNNLNNRLEGNSAANSLNAGAGNDVLIGHGGADNFNAGVGNDKIYTDFSFQAIEGGGGMDTVFFNNGGANFTLASGGTSGLLSNIEKINLTGSGNNTLTLTAEMVFAVTDVNHHLTIDGDSGDIVKIGAGWTSAGIANGYETLTQAGVTLDIAAAITVEKIITPYVIHNVDSAADVANHFTAGIDIIELNMGNNSYESAGFAVGVINFIDLTGFGEEDILRINTSDGRLTNSGYAYTNTSGASSTQSKRFTEIGTSTSFIFTNSGTHTRKVIANLKATQVHNSYSGSSHHNYRDVISALAIRSNHTIKIATATDVRLRRLVSTITTTTQGAKNTIYTSAWNSTVNTVHIQIVGLPSLISPGHIQFF